MTKKKAKAKKAKAAVIPNPIGRPPKYNPSFAPRIVARMAEGYSLTAAAANCDIHRDTVYEWESKYPAFSDAIKLGRAKRAAFLEIGLIGAPDGPTVTSRIFALKNAAPHEFREKIEVQRTLPDLTDYTEDELKFLDTIAARAARLSAGSDKA